MLAVGVAPSSSPATELTNLENFIEAAHHFGLTAPNEFREALMKSATQETKALVTQVIHLVFFNIFKY